MGASFCTWVFKSAAPLQAPITLVVVEVRLSRPEGLNPRRLCRRRSRDPIAWDAANDKVFESATPLQTSTSIERIQKSFEFEFTAREAPMTDAAAYAATLLNSVRIRSVRGTLVTIRIKSHVVF